MAWTTRALAATALMLALITGWASSEAGAASEDRWYRVLLEKGKTEDGYEWAMGASGPRNQPLRKICNVTSTLAPPNDAGYVEGDSLTVCGSLRRPELSAVVSLDVGSEGATRTVFEALYHPVVRKVIFVLDSGERMVYFPKVPKIPNRAAKGIPLFRYVVDTFEEELCVRKVTTFDKAGRAISREASPACPSGQGNL